MGELATARTEARYPLISSWFSHLPLITHTLPIFLPQVPFGPDEYTRRRRTYILRCYTSSGQEMLHNFRVTLVESLLGFLCGSLIGFLTGVAMAQSPFFQKMTLPFLIASNAIPVIAIAPIIVIWFGNTLLAKVVVAAFISFFPVVLNTYRGLMEYKTCFRELFSIYGGTEKQFLFKYKLGNAVPYIFTGLKLNATLCVIGAIVAEFVSSNEGLGFGILQASLYLKRNCFSVPPYMENSSLKQVLYSISPR